MPRSAASPGARRETSPGASPSCPGRSDTRWRRSTPSRAGSTTSPTIRACPLRSAAAVWRRVAARWRLCPKHPGRSRAGGARRCHQALPRTPSSAPRPGRRRAHGRGEIALRELGGAARVLPLRRRGGRAGLHGRVRAPRPGRGGPARRGPRALAPADQHHARRRRGLAPRTRLPSSGRAGALRRRRGRHRRRPRQPGLAGPDGAAGGARGVAHARRPELLPLLDRRSALCVRAFAGIYRGLLVQMRGRGYDVFSRRPQLSAVGKLRAVAAL